MWINLTKRAEKVLDESRHRFLKALSLFEIQLALHLSEATKNKATKKVPPPAVRVSKHAFESGRILAIAKMLEHLEQEIADPDKCLMHADFRLIHGEFLKHGGYRRLRYAMRPRELDGMVGLARKRARSAGVLTYVSLALPKEGKNGINEALGIVSANRLALGVKRKESTLKNRYRMFRSVAAFSTQLRLGKNGASFKIAKIAKKNFIPRLLEQIEDRNSIVACFAEFNAISALLRECNYSCASLAPTTIEIPEVAFVPPPLPDDVYF